MAPMKATNILPRLMPVTPPIPRARNIQPPTIAPTIPTSRSPQIPPGPGSLPGITARARKPAMIPTMIQANMLILTPPIVTMGYAVLTATIRILPIGGCLYFIKISLAFLGTDLQIEFSKHSIEQSSISTPHSFALVVWISCIWYNVGRVTKY